MDEIGDVGLEAVQQQAGDDREGEDAVGEGETVAAVVQLAGQVAVLGQDRGE
ncbi:hypothetical protein GCM10017771_86370 [Streptomyces capitiformicae]|uniref:Uncharacterized protein n=1 Tax=Streptomyces capitiformicae TaxID=2014920 RepID=A0A918ZPE4_9ACTN|nr:hypothetical protein GCM10017771_86370 [Streptomyces capitiformicae]